MTRDDIKLPPYLCASYEGDDLFSGDQLMDVVRAAVLAEREACAKVCEDQGSYEAVGCAALIRARGDKT